MSEPEDPFEPEPEPEPESEPDASASSEDAISPEEAIQAEPAEEPSVPLPPLPPPAVTVTGRVPVPTAAGPSPASARPDLLDRQEPLYRACLGFRLRLEPPDLARLRELPGSRGKSDEEIGETFFDGQAERLVGSVAGDVPEGAELRVVVDPYSRQAFVALENSIRGILSF